jgi:hypothetical protein
MSEIKLNGPLNLMGMLKLKSKVLVGGKEALVETDASGTAPGPVLIPPPPSPPSDPAVTVRMVKSFNSTVTATSNDKAIVTLGFVMQGTWPGMVLPSSNNTAPSDVKINRVAINVKDDSAVIFPSGVSVTLDKSGQ